MLGLSSAAPASTKRAVSAKYVSIFLLKISAQAQALGFVFVSSLQPSMEMHEAANLLVLSSVSRFAATRPVAPPPRMK